MIGRVVRSAVFATAIAVVALSLPSARAAETSASARKTLAFVPQARALCAALHATPAIRKQECCGASAVSLADVCARELSSAMKRGAVRVEADAVARCAEDHGEALAGCDWITPQMPPLVSTCEGMVQGTLKPGAKCQSSQECADGLTCRGLSTLAPGVCAKPAAIGAQCETPADNLAGYLRAKDDARHPVCDDGVCLRGRCLARSTQGQACLSTAQCTSGLHCLDGTCQDHVPPTIGEACSAKRDCSDGSVCVQGLCAARKGGGESCRLPFECRSLSCDKAPGAERGECADVCAAVRASL